jgi:protein-ribulosamine 3-kinase
MISMQAALSQLIPGVGELDDVRPVGGGCISEAVRVSVVGGERTKRILFVKRNEESFVDNFRCERDGLVRLSQPGVIGVPEPLAVGVAEGSAWLVTQWIEQAGRDREFFPRFGSSLAELHRATLGTEIGLVRDNYLGSARQLNTMGNDWAEFVVERRIGFQIRWARDQGVASDSLTRDCERIMARLDRILSGRDDATSLLHGDLWSGNYLCAADGRPFLIDPAVYHGCREAEFGMLRLFGSCPADFYEAYHDTFPLPGGWQHRVSVYVLYHLLNHLNLFGSGYLGQCQSVAAEILRG